MMKTLAFSRLEKTFFLRTDNHPQQIMSVSLDALLHPESVQQFIKAYGEKIKATIPDVVATFFSSYYGYLLSGVQYMISCHDTILDLSLANVEVQVYRAQPHDYYGLVFKVKKQSTEEPSCDRKQWRQEILEKLYSHNVVPLLQSFVKATNVRIRDLWGQVALSLYYGHDKILEYAQQEEQRRKVLADFHFLTKELHPQVFGLKNNPFDITFRMIEAPTEPGSFLRMKPSCCLYYLTEGAANKCYTCPRMTAEEREKRKLEIRRSL
ncbi:ferric iron reductase [Caldalkalibacillus thermarum TA2.A1]|uniref:(2Fe-2S)-binding protein n=1 Tax=Caldalkalibacillus thermarum (strain TA2.A1) TaxID=986075 RepID=F5L6C5_CALTT|nr:(2Fe-2S)-binding protein [Caldalkalibacillus thermarum]EGL83125.1 ferric iron reductase [Caldalkalibacillus thermarum TA2.A1]QZT32463.1 (2Fe-2S)-binding protein [Caldalkalibacillus thermarum TA2.A1]